MWNNGGTAVQLLVDEMYKEKIRKHQWLLSLPYKLLNLGEKREKVPNL